MATCEPPPERGANVTPAEQGRAGRQPTNAALTGRSASHGRHGGVRTLLRVAMTRAHASVAFSALRAADGTLSIAAYPEPDPLAAGSAWSLQALQEVVQQAWGELGDHKLVVRSLAERGPDGTPVVLEAVPLNDRPGAAWGLLGVAGPLAPAQRGERLEVLSDFSRRLTLYLRARQAVLDTDGGSAPASVTSEPPQAAGPEDGDAAPSSVVEAPLSTRRLPAPWPLQASSDEKGHERGRLGQLAVKGGAYLFGREAVGMVIRLVGVILTVRIIGPSDYGLYTGAAAFVLVVATLAQMGSEVYLIRMPGELDRRRYDQAFSFLLVTSLLATGISLALTFALAGVLRPVGVVLPLRVLLLSIPINVLWAPAQAKIERRFGYREMGLLELGGDVMLYGTAVPLAFAHFGEWSLVAGMFALEAWLLVGSLVLARLRPRWDWSWPEVKAMTHHGFGYSAGAWISRLTAVVNALVVGTFAGAAGVGLVSFAQNLVQTIGFGARGAYRLGLVAMSKVPNADKGRLRYAIEEGTSLQLAALAVPFACFALVARWIIPLFFGPRWTAAIPVYCFLALGTMLNAPSIIQCCFLLSRGDNWRVAKTGLISVAVLAVSGVVLVKELGTVGFGIAYVLSMVDTLYTDHVVRRTASFDYRSFTMLALALSPAVFFPLVPLPYALALLVPALSLAAVPFMRREALRLSQTVSVSIRSAVA